LRPLLLAFCFSLVHEFILAFLARHAAHRVFAGLYNHSPVSSYRPLSRVFRIPFRQ
jgi:hypothetical protein